MHFPIPFTAVLVTTLALAGCASGPPGARSASDQPAACQPVTEQQIAALFDRWNRSLQSGDPGQVLANYADRSYLLPTLSNLPRQTAAEKADYFRHFLENRPVGTIDARFIEIGCNSAVDTGLYTFTFGTTGAQVKARYTYTYTWNGKDWLISSHHSSVMPEKS